MIESPLTTPGSGALLASSRAFWLLAYFTQSHEILFVDTHARSFEAFGRPRRSIYDNMKTAVDKVPSMHGLKPCAGHYLFKPDFCSVVSGRGKGLWRRMYRIGPDK